MKDDKPTYDGPGIAPLWPPTPEVLELARKQVPGVDFPACTVDEATREVGIVYCPYVPDIKLEGERWNSQTFQALRGHLAAQHQPSDLMCASLWQHFKLRFRQRIRRPILRWIKTI